MASHAIAGPPRVTAVACPAIAVVRLATPVVNRANRVARVAFAARNATPNRAF